MWTYIYPAIALIFLLALSYTDVKDRIAPPHLTYSLLIIGIILHATHSIITENINPLIHSIAGALSMFTIAYAIYRAGGWAGGDVKLFTALGAIIPFHGQLSTITFPIPYPLMILVASTISTLPFIVGYGVYKVLEEKSQQLKKDILKSLPRSIYTGFALLAALKLTQIIGIPPISILIITPFIYISQEPGYPVTAFLATFALITNPSENLSLLIYFTVISIFLVTGLKTYKSIRKNVLRKEKPIKELREGEIPAEDIWIHEDKVKKKEPTLTRFTEPGNLKIDSRRARGLNQEELNFLKESELDKLSVKKSLPFIPILTLGFILLLLLEIFI